MTWRRFAILPLVLVVPWLSVAQEDAEREIMWRKLDLSHQILDALTLDDFEALDAYVEDLQALAESDVDGAVDADEYRAHSAAFRAAIRDLGEASRARDAEAGALAYVDLTLRCVRCHQSLGIEPR